ncbi:MAG: cation diffusion facilitator family transporter [Dehalococcoidia bacterium]
MRPERTGGRRYSGRLAAALAVNAVYLVVETVVGLLTGSLVLIADAGHMLTDVAGLSLALGAIWLAQRPANQRKTYGYYRAEVLAASVNALLLFAVSAYILYEAYGRFRNPPDVPSVPVVIVASVGLAVNLFGARILAAGAARDMNVHAAFLDMLADALGSVAAIAAGLIILTTGWRYADPLFAAALGLFILPRTWHLLKGAVDVLFEGTPSHIRVDDVQRAMLAVPDVRSVHDLHVWTVTSGFVALSGHVEVADGADRDAVLLATRAALHDAFAIDHVTIQVENPRLAGDLDQPCLPGETPCDAEPAANVLTGP